MTLPLGIMGSDRAAQVQSGWWLRTIDLMLGEDRDGERERMIHIRSEETWEGYIERSSKVRKRNDKGKYHTGAILTFVK